MIDMHNKLARLKQLMGDESIALDALKLSMENGVIPEHLFAAANEAATLRMTALSFGIAAITTAITPRDSDASLAENAQRSSGEAVAARAASAASPGTHIATALKGERA